MIKNSTNQVVVAQLNSVADGSAVTTGTTTVYVTGDGGIQASGSGQINHAGNGCWRYIPTQGETNYSHVAYTFVNTSAVNVTVQIYPQPAKIPTLADLKAQAENAMVSYAPIKTSVSGRLLDVSAGGEAGLDWANVGSPTTTVGFTNTTIGAVSGAVGSVTGNVGGNVVGSVGSVAASGISPATFGADVREQVAATIIKRGMVNDEGGLDNRSLGWAIAKLTNKVDLNAAGNTLTIRRTDDTTSLFTQTVTTSGGAAPITAVDTQ